jgi:Glycosyl hydrolase catalytic core
MVWGKCDIKKAIEENVIPEFRANRVHRLLAFNEPDHKGQADISVNNVVDDWPLFENVNIPLASPSVAHPLGGWCKNFFQTAAERGLQMEYTALHYYGSANVERFKTTMLEAYELYGKRPLIITEFAVADWDAKTPEDNRV